jgi:hypothetical protein
MLETKSEGQEKRFSIEYRARVSTLTGLYGT